MSTAVQPLPSLLRLNASHVAAATAMCARAFHDDPLYRYFLPDVRQRERVLPAIFRFRLRYALECGEVYATSVRMEGVAIWMSSETERLTPWRFLRTGGLTMMLSAGSDARRRMQAAIRWASAIRTRQANFPHWHLSPIAVEPAHQGKGHASTLMRAMLARLDAEGMPVFLETQTERNVAIYEHYGFRVVEKAPMPHSDLTHWAMLRGAPGA